MGSASAFLFRAVQTAEPDQVMKRLLMLLQLGCALLFLLWAAHEINWEDLKVTLPAVSLFAVVLLVLFRLVIYVLLGWRLTVLLYGNITLLQGISSAILCIGCNNILPARLGEICKIGFLRSRAACGIPTLSGAVAIERGMDVFCLLGMAVFFGVAVLALPTVWVLLGMGLLLMIGWVLLWKTAFVRSCCRRTLPLFFQQWTEEILDSLVGMKKRKVFGRAGILSLCIWGCNFIHAELITNMLFPLNLPLRETGLLCVVLFGSSALFLVPGGYGLMEGAVTALLLFWGVEKTQALAIALWGRLYYSLVPLTLSSVVVACSSKNTFRYTLQ